MKTIVLVEKINKTFLYLAVFLIPIFFLPFAQDYLEYPKQTLLLVLVTVSLGAWFLKQILQKKIIIRKIGLIHYAILALLASFLLSAIFSLWPKASFFGFPLDITDSFVSFVIFAFLALLIANSFQEEKDLSFLVMLLIGSGALASAFGIFQLYRIFLFPAKNLQNILFNTIGAFGGVAVLSALLLPISLFYFFKTSGPRKTIIGVSALILLLSIIVVNFKTAWNILILIVLILSVFGARDVKGKAGVGWTVVTMGLLTISLFFLFFPLRFPIFPIIPTEVSPSFSSEVDILKGVFSGGVKNIFLGTGPSTFIFDYSKFRSPLLNQSIFWGNRFYRGDSVLFDWIITKGILGGMAIIFLMAGILYALIKSFLKNGQQKNNFFIKNALFASMIGMILLGPFYAFNFVLWFVFWVFLGILLACDEIKKNTEIRLEQSSAKMTGTTLVFLVIFFSGISLFFFQGKRYIADVNYLEGIRFSHINDLDRAISKIEKKAIGLAPDIDVYWRDLGQMYLAKADYISRDKNLSPQERADLAQSAIKKGMEAVNKAVNIAPANVANWNIQGFFFRNLIGIEKAGELALASYRRAISLEPASPFAYGEMGRVYILLAQDFSKKQMSKEQDESLSFAVSALNRAIELKTDYAPAHYLLAVVYDQQKNIDGAIKQLETTKINAQNDSGVVFQLGLLYWRKNEVKKAQEEFKRATELNPSFSNALYMLGLSYDSTGQAQEAIKQFEKIAQLNPENEQIIKILENLYGGLPALHGVVVTQPPIEEVPLEFQKNTL